MKSLARIVVFGALGLSTAAVCTVAAADIPPTRPPHEPAPGPTELTGSPARELPARALLVQRALDQLNLQPKQKQALHELQASLQQREGEVLAAHHGFMSALADQLASG